VPTVLASRLQGSLGAAQESRVRARRHGLSCLRRTKARVVLDWRRSHSILPSNKQDLFRPPSTIMTTAAARSRVIRLVKLPSVGFSTNRISHQEIKIIRSYCANLTLEGKLDEFFASKRCSCRYLPFCTMCRAIRTLSKQSIRVHCNRVADKVAANLSIISGPPLIPGFSPSPKPNMSACTPHQHGIILQPVKWSCIFSNSRRVQL
jgi:hypothetical protein